MDFLQLVKKNFQFHKVEQIDESTLLTETGRKKVYFWDNRELLDWHIAWRDECSEYAQILTNRMLRTVDQQADVNWKEGWFTLHDEVTTLAPMKGKEENWARLFVKMFTFGTEQEKYSNLVEKRDFPNFQEVAKTIQETKLPTDKKNILLAFLQESKIRLKKGQALLKNIDNEPIVDPVYSIEQGKAIYDMIYWEGTNDTPEKGLRSFAQFLYEWYLKNGENSAVTLINEINESFPLREKFGKILIGEMLIPWELDIFIKNIESLPIDENYERFISDWEKKRQFVNILGKWFVEERKKVAT